VAEALADHWEAGEKWERATPYLLQAARKAKLQYGLDQAIGLAERAWSAANRIAEPSPLAIEALTVLGDLLSLKGDVQGANAHYEKAMAREGDAARRRSIGNRRHDARSVRRAGGRITYYEHGTGPVTLAFVHPFLYGLSVFQPLIEELCQEFRIITIDPRGAGASDPLTSDYGMHDHMEDVRAVLMQAAVSQGPVVAVGISRGALLLIRLATLHPDLLSRMILVGGFTRQTVGIGASPVEQNAGLMRELTDAVQAGNLRHAAEIFAPTIYSEPGTEELRRQFVEQCVALPRETVTRFWTLDPQNDVTDLLEKVPVPTLVAHGGEDGDTPVAMAREMAKRIPGASFYVFHGKGHLPTFTATHEFITVLRQFVKDGDGTVAPPSP
jgi:pimeloyl-ACP methyl ester carboxylesterase